ncbi:MAG: serine/threonine-protein kinase [Acidobacteriota bacterium]
MATISGLGDAKRRTELQLLMTTLSGETTLDGEPRRESAHARSTPADQNLGCRIGPYRVERLIARGGMGRVYLATREDDYEQQVALKLIDRGTRNIDLVGQFFRERQILAQLQHPGIARILDGGSTHQGMPYFVMEYVEGEPVDRFCDRHQLDLRERLELVQQICAVVQFSHQNLVIHQDLKPGNILVTAEGEPKLLDFGIAELLDPEPEAGGSERVERRLTPSYASPEQFRGEAVTTASDIYSLGVLLYRLVSGLQPYRLQGLGIRQVRDLVCAGELEPPSRVAPFEARRRLEGDIDAIVQKAMHLQPARRYASAAQLAEDLRRHLADLPIEADPGSWRQRLRKSVRRNRLGLVVLLVILGFAITTTVFWRQAVQRGQLAEAARSRAESAQVEAQNALLRAERVAGLLEDIFHSGDPDAGALSVREVLDRGRQRLLRELEEDPEIRAQLLASLGTVYNNLSLYQEARKLKEASLRIRLEHDPTDRQELAATINNLGRLLYDLGDYPAAEEQFRGALAMWDRLGDARRVVLGKRNLATLLAHSGRPEEALQLHREILEDQRRLFGARDLEVANSLYSLAALRRNLGMLSEAEPLLRQALEIFEESLGPEHTRVAAVLSSLGRILHAQGRYPEARQHLERALEVRLQLLGEDHVHSANSRKNLAALLLEEGETESAGELLTQALATLRSKKPAGDWTIADAESLWGSFLATEGRYTEAEPVLLGAYQTLRDAKGEQDIATGNARRRVHALYQAWGKSQRAAAFAQGP